MSVLHRRTPNWPPNGAAPRCNAKMYTIDALEGEPAPGARGRASRCPREGVRPLRRDRLSARTPSRGPGTSSPAGASAHGRLPLPVRHVMRLRHILPRRRRSSSSQQDDPKFFFEGCARIIHGPVKPSRVSAASHRRRALSAFPPLRLHFLLQTIKKEII